MERGGISFELILEKKILRLNFVITMKTARISGFCRAAERHFYSIAGPRNVSVDL